MGQGIVHSHNGAEYKADSLGRSHSNNNSRHAASYPQCAQPAAASTTESVMFLYSVSPTAAPIIHGRSATHSGAPDDVHTNTSRTLLAHKPQTRPPVKSGRPPPDRCSDAAVSPSPPPPPSCPSCLSLCVSHESHGRAVSGRGSTATTEFNNSSSTTNTHRLLRHHLQLQGRFEAETWDAATLAAAVEEVAAPPAGELECLASGFLSLADYMFVAETVQGLSRLLLHRNSHTALGGVGADGRGSTDSAATTFASPAALASQGAVHSAAGTDALRKGMEEGQVSSALHWTAMREALVARRGSQSKSTSSNSRTALTTTTTTVSTTATNTTTHSSQRTNNLRRTTVFDSSPADGEFRHDAGGHHCSSRNHNRGRSHSNSPCSTFLSGGAAAAAENAGKELDAAENIANTTTAFIPYRQSSLAPLSSATPLSATLESGASRRSSSTPRSSLRNAPLLLLPSASSEPLGAVARFSSDATATTEAVRRPLTIDDLVDITSRDEVLDVLLQSMTKRIRGLARQLRVLTPYVALRYCMQWFLRSDAAKEWLEKQAAVQPQSHRETNAITSTAKQASDDSTAPQRTQADAAESPAAAPSAREWVIADTVIERAPGEADVQAAQARASCMAAMGADAQKLFANTKGVLHKALKGFAAAMPLALGSRLNNGYLLPTVPIAADFVGCGAHTRRRQEFFVSMRDRVRLLKSPGGFESPEALLLGLSQLSNLASHMLSSFALGAALACTTRWRELHDARGAGSSSSSTATNTNTTAAVVDNNDDHDIGDVMEDFAMSYCAAYDVLCNEAFPGLRKQYPNVFVASSFGIREDEGGRPPMLTVAVSTLLKLLFLFAGGLESIRADDRRLVAASLEKERLQHESETRRTTTPPSAVSLFTALHASADGMGGGGRTASTRASVYSSCDHDQQQQHTPPRRRERSISGQVDADDPHSHHRSRSTLTSGVVSSSRRSHSTAHQHTVHQMDQLEASLSEDVALATALQVRSASVLVMVGAIVITDPPRAAGAAALTHDSARLAVAVSRMWRVLFQAAGLLPHGPSCPREMAKWLPLFPLYAVSTEAKRTLLEVYGKTLRLRPLRIGPILRDDVLRSTAGIVAEAVLAEQDAEVCDTATVTATCATSSVGPSTTCLSSPSTQTEAPPYSSSGRQTTASVSGSSTPQPTIAASPQALQQRESDRGSRRSGSNNNNNSAVSAHLLLPFFAAGSRRAAAAAAQMRHGLGGGGGGGSSGRDYGPVSPLVAKELRKDLYERIARQLDQPFLPVMNITSEVRAVPLPGGLATFRADDLQDHSAAELRKLESYQNHLTLVVAWRKSAVAARIANAEAGRVGEECITPYSTSRRTRGASTSALHETLRSGGSSDAPFRFPIAVGDEVAIRWGPSADRKNGSTLPLEADEEEEGGERRSSPAAVAAVPERRAGPRAHEPPPPPQRHAVVAVLPTIWPHQCLVVLDSDNYLSSYVNADSSSTAVPSAPVTAAASAVASPSASTRKNDSRRQSFLKINHRRRVPSGGRRQSVVSVPPLGLVHLEAAAAAAPTVTDLLHYRVQEPVLLHDEAMACAWTNTSFLTTVPPAAAAAAHAHPPLPPLPSSSSSPTPATTAAGDLTDSNAAVAFLIGWLLGESLSNDVVFSLPLPPLAFRILSLALRLEDTTAPVRLEAADLSLLSNDVAHAHLSRGNLADVRRHLQAGSAARQPVGRSSSAFASPASVGEEVHLSGSPALVRRHVQRAKQHLADALAAVAWGGETSDGAARTFWTAVLQGLRQTPLPHSPLFDHCCSRTLREVLCGQCDTADADFCFRESFLVFIHLHAPETSYRHYIRTCVLRVLDDDFSLAEKRLLLRFITGHSLRTDAAKCESIGIDVQHHFASVPDSSSLAASVSARQSSRRLTQLRHLSTTHGDENAAASAGGISTETEKGEAKTVPGTSATTKARMHVSRAAIDATLHLLPYGRTADNTLFVPNYFEALLMGTYRERALGAEAPWLAAPPAASDTDSTCGDKEARVVLEEADFQSAWTSLSSAQQEQLKRRFRVMLIQRLRAALYASLIGREDSTEEAWALAAKLGLAAAAAAPRAAGAGKGHDDFLHRSHSNSGDAANDASTSPLRVSNGGGGSVFVRRHDGTLGFIDGDLVEEGLVDSVEGFPYCGMSPFGDDDDDEEDDTDVDDVLSATAEMHRANGELLLSNSVFGNGSDDHGVDGRRASAKRLGAAGLRGSLNSTYLSIDSSNAAQQPSGEEYATQGTDLNGYRTAASFCFEGDDVDLLLARAAINTGELPTDSDREDEEEEGEDSAEVRMEKVDVSRRSTLTEKRSLDGTTPSTDSASAAVAAAAAVVSSSSHASSRLGRDAAAPAQRERAATSTPMPLEHRVRASTSSYSAKATPPPTTYRAVRLPLSGRQSYRPTLTSAPAAVAATPVPSGLSASKDATAPTTHPSLGEAEKSARRPSRMAGVDAEIEELFPDDELLAG